MIEQSGPTDYYVNPVTGNNANDGSQAHPWKSINDGALPQLLRTNLNGYLATLNLADGTYDETANGIRVDGPYIGPGQHGYIWFKGNVSHPENVIINSGQYNGFYVWNCYAYINGVTVGSTTRDGIAAVAGAWVGFDSVVFNKARYHIRSDYGSTIQCDGNYKIRGTGTGAHWYAKNGGTIEGFGLNIDCLGANGSFGIAFAQAQFGRIDTGGMVWANAGGLTGRRALATENGAIQTNGGGKHYFPGTTDPATSNGAPGDWGVYQ